MNRLLLLLTLILLTSGIHDAGAQGLRFHGNESDIADRSALTIPSPDDRISAVSHLKVDFSIRVNNPSSSGFIFGITNRRTGEMLNLMLRSTFSGDSVYISFAKEGERELCTSSFHTGDLSTRAIGIGVEIDKKADSGRITIDGKTYPVDRLGVADGEFTPQLNFGLTRHIVETASVTLSDLRVATDGVTHEIPLNESEGTAVHDSKGKVAGLVFNPIWQINEAYHWRKIAEFKSPVPTGCAFDPLYSRFYSYNADSISVFDANTLGLSRRLLKGDGRLPVRHGMNFYSSRKGKIYPYEIYYDDFSGEIDPESGEWRTLAHTADNKAIHHHAHLLCGGDSAVWLFGGYGDRKYFNKFVRFDLYTHRFDTIPLKGDVIPPRFFAAMGAAASGDTIYLYGGKGNKEGKQDLGVKYYYDLYLINLKDSTSRRLWRRPAPDKDRVPARTLLLDPDGKHAYAMTYPEYRTHSSLQLYRISLADGSETAVGDSIPVVSEEIATNVAIYSPVGADRIFCVIQEFEKEGATTTRIYSIAAPPVSESELLLDSSEERSWPGIVVFLLIGVTFTLLLFAVTAEFKRRKLFPSPHVYTESVSKLGDSGMTKADASGDKIAEVTTDEVFPVVALPDEAHQTEDSAGLSQYPDTLSYRILPLPELPVANRISLLGAFTAIGHDGIDVTHLFSPKLKVIFIYMLMGTLKRGGVSADELNAVFWPDKESDKIKNLRNVTIAKLRKILTEFRELEIVYDNGRFSIAVGDGCYCDIHRLYRLTDNLHDIELDEESLPEVRAIIAQGKFLQGVETAELDVYKSSVEAYSLDLLLRLMREYAERCRWEEVARCCQVALRIDPLCEGAMRNGVWSYTAMGHKTRARNLYDNFAATYRKVYSQDYFISFSSIIEEGGQGR